jgi:hypothetical protein
MSMHFKSPGVIVRRAALAVLVALFAGNAAAQVRAPSSGADESPFAQLAGNWSGSGTIDLSNGRHEAIRCRASYDVLDEQDKLQLNIHCASESYQFNLQGSASYAGGTIKGNWSESTRNAAGTLAGKVAGSGFQVVANGPSFSANLNLATRGDSQSVKITSRDSQTSVRGATITLQRGQAAGG